MRAAWACALLVAVLVAASSVHEAHALVDANNQTLRSINGCECLSECGYSFDVAYSWCYTSEVGESSPCGTFFPLRQRYGDECIFNATTNSSTTYLHDFDAMWKAIAWSGCVTTTTVYAIAGVVMAFSLGARKGRYIFSVAAPIGAAACGFVLSIAVVGVAAIFIASIYLSIPYLIEEDAAIALGIALALLTVYQHLGRGFVSIEHDPRIARL